MPFTTVQELKQHLNLTSDSDDALLESKITSAQESIENFIGYPLVESDVPAPLKEAVLQLAAHFYDEREGKALPLGVFDLVGPYRTFAF